MFLHESITGHPHISKEVLQWDTTLTVANERVKLREVLESMQAKIKDDLQRLKLAKILDSQSQGCFRKLDEHNIYVYEHNGYIECSAARLTQFKICCMRRIQESLNLIFDAEHEYKNAFLPFFYPNPVLLRYYDRIYRDCTSPSGKKAIKEWKDRAQYVITNKVYRDDKDKCFSIDSKYYCHGEDVWSERLGSILKTIYSNVIEVTAPNKGNAANEVILKKLPSGVTLKMLLFHGCPDLIISSYPIMLNKGCVENKQNGEYVPYTNASLIPDQCGQLLACVYQFMVVQYLAKIMNGEASKHVRGRGMFIIRRSDVHLFSACISDDGLQIEAESYTSCENEVAMFSYVMDRFIKSITE